MGLLDDAIREHLDLKRRRGADPAEVARLEHEALGPVRREPAPAEPTGDQPPAPAAEPSAHAEHPLDGGHHADDATHVLAPHDRHDPPHGDPLHEHQTPAPEAEGGAEQPHSTSQELGGAAAPQPSATDADRAGGVAEDDSATPVAESPRAATGPARSSAGPEDAGATEAQDPRHSDIVHQPTTEFHVEDHHDDEDVLEETPDFLQETPEHDRLWFEQRPPRDFDFDG